MRVLWHSNAPWNPSGYGSQTRLFAPRLRDLGHEVAISAYWGLNGGVMGWEGLTVYPGDEVWGNRLLADIAAHHRAELVITLMDVWVLDPKRLAGLPALACWVPVDHEPCPEKVLRFLQHTGATPIAMSRFGERMLTDAGLRPLYVPHGVDTRVFRPKGTRVQTRERILAFPDDAFVIGMVAANKGNNPPRKAFPQVLQAFARLRAERPNSYLYLHCDPVGQGGVHIAKLADQLGIPDEALRCPNQLQLELGVPPEEMADLYCALDVLASPSYGEGFGIPIIEAQACGTPVIVTDGTAMTELAGPGWLVHGDPWFDPIHRAFYTCPSVDGIYQAMRDAYDRRGDVKLRNAARSFALSYDVAAILRDHWRPVLAQLQERVAGARELAAA